MPVVHQTDNAPCEHFDGSGRSSAVRGTIIDKRELSACIATLQAPRDWPNDRSWSEVMNIRSPPQRTDALTGFVQRLPDHERRGGALSLLEKKRFDDFRAVFNLKDSVSDLRRLGGTVHDIPPLPADASVHLEVDAKDSGLSLLHWAVRSWRDFSYLLFKAPWTSEDLLLTTSHGFTALHCAVLFDVETLPLRRLLSIAREGEVKSAWKRARKTTGGVGVSPLHLAVMYGRNAIVAELLRFGWDPTEPMEGPPRLDAYDLTVLKDGAATVAAASPDTLRVQSMERGPHRIKVEHKLSSVILVRDIVPAIPFVFLVALILFALPCFFRPPMLATALMDVEKTVIDCVNPDTTNDSTRDGVLPWDCPVGFTEVGMRMKIFPNHGNATAPAKMQSYVAFLEKEDIPRNVTHLPWSYIRFSKVVEVDSGSLAAPASSMYRVFTELRKVPQWAAERQEQPKAEPTWTFDHTVIPDGTGDHRRMFSWLGVLTATATVASFCVLVNVKRFVAGQAALLVKLSDSEKSAQVLWLVCEGTAVACAAAGAFVMASVFVEHRHHAVLDRATILEWQQAERFLRAALISSSLRTARLVAELPQRHYSHIVTAFAAAAVIVATVAAAGVVLKPPSAIAWSLVALVWTDADLTTLLIVLGVSLFLHSPGISHKLRQAHFENLLLDVAEAHDRNQTASVPQPVTDVDTQYHSRRVATAVARFAAAVLWMVAVLSLVRRLSTLPTFH